MSRPMTDKSTIEAELAPLTAGRATARVEGARASIVLDVTGLSNEVREELEADVRRVARALPGIDEVRVLQTSERRTRRLVAVASG
jgi:ATP-binding protein involved in chromosome partitioning